jgi:plasmid stabilization system protein ParE
MTRFFKPFAAALLLLLALGFSGPAHAQSAPRELLDSLSRLQNNPSYAGRILGTQLRRSAQGPLYEVRILRPDDQVVIVYIDPKTGGVVGDSLSRGKRGGSKKRN